MVVDTSAIAAILFMEREADDFLWKMERADSLKLSAVTLLELSMIAMRLGSRELEEDLEAFLRRGGFQVVPLTYPKLCSPEKRFAGSARAAIPPGSTSGTA